MTLSLHVQEEAYFILAYVSAAFVTHAKRSQLGFLSDVVKRPYVFICSTLAATVKVLIKSNRLTYQIVNAFVYSILTHEYLHALGHVSEAEVRSLVYDVSKECFGPDHIVTTLAEKTPWVLIKGVPLNDLKLPKQDMELIKDLEKPNHKYIV